MPYKDPDRQRQARREWARRERAARRSGGGGTKRTEHATACPAPRPPLLPPEVRLKAVRDVLDLLQGQLEALLADATLTTTDRARCVGYLAGLALRAIESGDLADRLEALERLLNGGGTYATPYPREALPA